MRGEPTRPRRLVFLGTPAAAVPSLRGLVEAGFEVALVVSQPDRRRGRGGATSPSPVKAAALEMDLPVTDRVDDAVGVGADLGVVVAYGQILRPPVLAALPMVNVHFSLLPRWRGAAPVERALLAGDAVTGVCIMEVVQALDAGGVHARAEVPIGPDATAPTLTARLAEVGADLLVDTLRAGLVPPEPQDGEVTYAEKITPEDLRLDWARPATELERVVRVGGAWTTFRGRRLRIWAARPAPGQVHAADDLSGTRGIPGVVADGERGQPGGLALEDGAVTVATGAGRLVLDEVQPEGKARQAATAWANGARLDTGQVLGR